MIRKLTFVIAIIFTAVMLYPTFSIAALFRFAGRHRTANTIVHFFSVPCSRLLVWSTWTRVSVRGRENLPEHNNFCIVGNHQNFGDIPILYGWVGRYMGFIAKIELKRVPALNYWIWSLRSIFIDRNNGRQAIGAIRAGIESIKNGHPLVVFPEGTRSGGPEMGRFKKGSLKLATKSGGAIVPVTLSGSWRIMSGKSPFTVNRVELIIHPPIETKGIDEKEVDVALMTEEVVRSGLSEPHLPA